MKDYTLYTCNHDYQGTDFALGRTRTINGWRNQGIEWATMDDHYGIVTELRKLPKNEVIDYIAEFWQIGIVKTETLRDEELDDLAQFSWYYEKQENRKKTIDFMKKYC